MLTTFDVLLFSLVIFICAAGLKKRWAEWRQGNPETRTGNWGTLISSLLTQQKVLRRRIVGAAHLILFWGFLFNGVIVVLSQLRVTMPDAAARALSLIGDLLGIAMLGSVIFFTVRRVRWPRRGKPMETLFPLALILIIILTGFLSEGARLVMLGTNSVGWSPVGSLFSIISPASPLYLFVMIRVHFFAVLLFLAAVPFTLLRHLVTTPLNIYYGGSEPLQGLMPAPLNLQAPGAGTAADFTWKHLLDVQACTMCGRCEESCPAMQAGKPLSPHKIIRTIFDQTPSVLDRNNSSISLPALEEDIADDELWSCTTCGACNYECPAHLQVMEKIIDLRRHQVEQGRCPALSAVALESSAYRGNPWGLPPTDRMMWAEHLKAPLARNGAKIELLYWVGCAGSYDPLGQEISRAMLRLLDSANVNYAVLGTEERCCGDPARRLGDEGLFQEVCRENIATFKNYNITKILTHCPHCFNMFKNEYPLLGGCFEVLHHTRLLRGLVVGRRVSERQPPQRANLFYQDPCYLGRYNGGFDDARKLIESIPAAHLSNTGGGEKAFCCGGGGGQLWLDVRAGERIENVGMARIARTQPEIIATACPFCKIMFDTALASRSARGEKWSPRIKDIAELLAEVL